MVQEVQGLNVAVNHPTLMICKECKPKAACPPTIPAEQPCAKDHPPAIPTTEALHPATQTSDPPAADLQAACLPAAHPAEALPQATQETEDPAASQASQAHPARDQAALATSLETSESQNNNRYCEKGMSQSIDYRSSIF